MSSWWIVAIQGRFPWGSIDNVKTDWVGTGEAFNSYSPSPNDGAQHMELVQHPELSREINERTVNLFKFGGPRGQVEMARF
jgi:hypothetical protein